MITPPAMKWPSASCQAAARLMSTPTNVRMLGWIRSATQALMISRSGNKKIRPMSPVSVIMRQVPRLSLSGASPYPVSAYNERFRRAPKRAVYCMPIRDLKTQIARLPEQPGVYLYYNGQGETLYVGKARVLRDRVRSYLGAHGTSPRIDALLDEAQRLEVIVTDSVVEALALENNLIKQRAPKYNILLRDDKTYPYLQLTSGEAFPRVLVARRVERDGHFYAGPFMPASLARRTMSLTHKLFGIRSCNEAITGDRAAPLPRVRHQAVHRAVRPRALLRGRIPRGRRPHEAVPGRTQRRAAHDAARPHGGAAHGRTVRAGGADRAMPSGPSRRCAPGSRRWRAPATAIAMRSG